MEETSTEGLGSPLLRIPIGKNGRTNLITLDFVNVTFEELRREIYCHLLPSTLKPSSQPNIVWLRGCMTLLQVSRQLYEECAELLYGTNTFEIDIKYDSIRFRYTWLTATGLKPKMLYSFPSHFVQRNVRLIRHYVINVEHVDSYQGMIKYNCGGPGLTAGVRNQVRTFVQEIRKTKDFGRVEVRLTSGSNVLSDLRRVKVHCVERGKDMEATQKVLEPFQDLKDVRWAEVSGAVTQEYAARIEQAMTEPSTTVDPKSLSFNTEELNLDPAVLWRWKNSWNA